MERCGPTRTVRHLLMSVLLLSESILHGVWVSQIMSICLLYVGSCVYTGDETPTVYSRGEQCSGGDQLTDGSELTKVVTTTLARNSSWHWCSLSFYTCSLHSVWNVVQGAPWHWSCKTRGDTTQGTNANSQRRHQEGMTMYTCWGVLHVLECVSGITVQSLAVVGWEWDGSVNADTGGTRCCEATYDGVPESSEGGWQLDHSPYRRGRGLCLTGHWQG